MRTVRVLLVEDSPTYAALVRASLRAHDEVDFAVTTEGTLDGCLGRLKSSTFDAVLLDLWLPDSSGLDTFARITETTPGLPVVVLTGLDDRRIGVQAVTMGAQDYLVKGRSDTEIMARALLYAIERHRVQRAREQFFSAISHELRTPLFAILGHAELLLDPDVPNDDQTIREFATTIRDLSQELLAHVNEILDLSKLLAGSLDLQLRRVELAAVIDDVVRAMGPLAQQAGLELGIETRGPPPVVRAHGDRLRQVLLNLLSNAVKYTPPGGRVTLRTEQLADVVAVSVVDTGVGIAGDALPHIFEPFYQAEGVEAQRGQASTGLGLALTKQLVEAQGGELSVDSTPGAGSAFTFTLRALPAEDEADAQTAGG